MNNRPGIVFSRGLAAPASICLALMLLLTSLPAMAAGPSLPQILNSTGAGQQDKAIDVVPDPLSLRPDWWRFFAVPAEELAARVERAKSLLDLRYGQGSDRYGPQRQRLIERIQSNLDAFVAASQLKAPEVFPAPGISQSDTYTPAQALALVQALRDARLELSFDTNETNALISAIDATSEEIDRALASYLQQPPGSPEKLNNGFDIMLSRTSLASTQQQLRLRRAGLEVRQAQVNELAQAEAVAEQRLRADSPEVLRLSEQISALQPVLDKAAARVLAEKQSALEASAETAQDRVAALYRRQSAVRAAVDLEVLRLQMENLKTQRELARMLVTDTTVDTAAVQRQLESVRKAIDQARKGVADWTAASERERDRAGEALSRPGGERGGERGGDAGGTSQSTVPGVSMPSPAWLVNQDRLRLAQESMTALRSLNDEITQLEFLTRWTAKVLHSNEGPISRIISAVSEAGYKAGNWMTGITDRSLFKLGSTPITLAGLFQVLVIILLAWLLSWLFRRLLVHLGHRFPKENQSLLFIIGRLAHYLIIGIGVIAGLSSIGLNFTNFALVAGALALGLGFGLQSIVNNFLSGLILFFERTVKVGDFVELDNGQAGEIKSINVRGTIVNTNDNIDIVVPNSQFIERKVTNWTLLDPFRRIHVPFRVAYDADEDQVVAAGLDAAGRLSSTLTGVLGREPSVWLVNYGENGLDFELIVWLLPDAVKRPEAIFAAYQWEIKKALRRFDIEVPVPQREIRFRAGHSPGEVLSRIDS